MFLTKNNPFAEPIAPQEHHPGGFWTGGNDLRTESTWEWGTSGMLVEPLWYPLDYQHRNTTNCLMLNTDRTYSDFRLLEADCHRKLYFVCELSKDLLFEGELQKQKLSCLLLATSESC